MSDHTTERGALTLDAEPTELSARVVDRDGDVWARHAGRWGCLTVASSTQTWSDLWHVCGPLTLVPVPERPARRVVDGNTDPCPAPGYRLHTAVGAGAISEPYLCHGCQTWFTLSRPSQTDAGV